VFINYIDRGNLSVSAADIIKEMSVTPEQMGLLLSAFFWTYAACQMLSGWLIDRFDVHWIFGLGFLLWSASTAATGLVGSFAPLFALRLILGVGESVAYPAFSKIIAADFPETQRGKANGLIDAGSKVGPAIGTLVGGLIVAKFGWRSLFLILGLGAFLWLPFWILWTPRKHPAQKKAVASEDVPSMLTLLKMRSVWGTFFGLFAINYAWYFMITWFPFYLIRERHFSTERMAILGSLPFWMIALTSVIGGFASDRLIAGGATTTRVRKSFIASGLLMTTLLLPAAMAQSESTSMALFLVACLAFGFTSSNHWALTQSIAGPVASGKWTGLQNSFGNLAGVTAPWLTGVIVQRTNSFYLAFVAVAVVVVLGATSFVFIVGQVEPVDWRAVRLRGGHHAVQGAK
jgi:MFS transporter, ACS family, D-galactonate transporter